MQTSRFQLGLIATLAVGLGFSLSSSEAVGYPAGPAISLGSNPVWSTGGNMGAGDHIVATATSGDLIITDIHLTTRLGNVVLVKFQLTDGTVLAEFNGDDIRQFGGMIHTFASGLRVPNGESLTINWGGYYGASDQYNYTLSGYYAQP